MKLLDNYIEKIKKEPPLLKREEVEGLLKSSIIRNRFFYISRIAAIFAIVFMITYFFFQKREKNLLNQIQNQIAYNDMRYANLIDKLSKGKQTPEVRFVKSNQSSNNKIPVNKSALLVLSKERLQQIGFRFAEAIVTYEANVKGKGRLEFWLEKNNTTVSVSDQQSKDFNTYDFYPLYVSDLDGKQDVKYRLTNEPENKKEMFSRQINSLIPVLVSVPESNQQKIFWFLSTESLLNVLEQDVVKSDNLMNYFIPSKKLGFKMFPNPAKNTIQIEADFLDSSSKISLLDIHGELVRVLKQEGAIMKQSPKYHFRLDGIKKGMYFISITSKSSSPIIRRLIITN